MKESLFKLEYATRLLELASSVDCKRVQGNSAYIYISILSVQVSIQTVLWHLGVPEVKIQACCRSPYETIKLLQQKEIRSEQAKHINLVDIEETIFNDAFPHATIGAFLSGISFADNPGELDVVLTVCDFPAGIVGDVARHVESWARQSINENDAV